jgi:hypothetical protein
MAKESRYRNNLVIDGYLDLSQGSATTGRYLKLPSLATAPSSPAVGMGYHDSTLDKIRFYQGTGWTTADGTAAGSLDAAYNGGGTITVDGSPVTLNDSIVDNGALLITSSGVVTGSSNVNVLYVNSTGAHNTSGRVSLLNLNMGAETAATPEGARITMQAETDNAVKIVKGSITIDDGGLTLSSVGNATTSGFTATTANTSGDGYTFNIDSLTSGDGFIIDGDATGGLVNYFCIQEGSSNIVTVTDDDALFNVAVEIDIDDADAFLVTEADNTEVLSVDTTQDAGDTTVDITSATTTGVGVKLTSAVTTGNALEVNADSATSGNGILVSVASSTMTTSGAAISVIDADNTDREVFAVRDDGSVYMYGAAEGTTVTQAVTGDVVITDGDLTLSGGEVSVTDGVTTAGSGILLTSSMTTAGAAAGAAGALTVIAASATTGTVLSVTADAITTGDMLYLDAGGGTMTAGSGFFINCNDDNASVFTVSSDGRVVIAGTASGTNAIAVTAGDITLSSGSIALTDTNADQFAINYDGSNSFGVDVDSDGSTTLTTTGTNADLELVSGTAGDITLDSTGDIILEAGGSDINADAPLNITVAGGSQLELIAAGSIKAVHSVANTTGNYTITASGGTGNIIELVGDTITLDSAGDIALEAGGADVTMDAQLSITNTSADQLKVIYDGSNDFGVDVDADGSTTLTTTGTDADFEIATGTGGDITLDATGDIVLEAGGADITADAQITLTTAVNEASLVVVNNTITTGDQVVSVASTSITTGAMMTLNANAAAHDGEVLEIISAGDATSTPKGISVTMSNVAASAGADSAHGIWVDLPEATSGANGIEVRMDKITTGDMLKLDAGGGTMTGAGRYINCVDDAADKFTVASDGAVTIAGTAAATDALTLTLGDILVSEGHVDMTVGDLTLADGSVSITDADAATSLTVINNSVAGANLVDISSTGCTDGAMMKINANAVTHDGEILELISAGDASATPTGISVTIPDVTTGAATGIDVTMVGLTTTGFGIKVTMDAITTGDMLYLDNGGGTLTGDGKFINCNDDNVSLFAVAADGNTTIAGTAAGTAALTLSLGDLVITDSDGSTISSVDGTADLLTLDNAGGAIASGEAVLKVDAGGVVDAAGYGIYASFTGSAAAGATVVGVVPDAGGVGVKINAGGVVTQEALYIDADPTAHSVAYLHSDAILAADKAILEVHHDTGASNADSALIRVHQDHTSGASFCVQLIQDDLDVPFINFEGTSSADELSPISSLNTGTTTDFVRCAINGAKAWIPVVTGALS